MFDSPITWMSALRLGLGWAGEYALLSLIEDAPITLKIATMLCAIGALAALESRAWLNSQRDNLFQQVIICLSGIYLSFVGYAIYWAIYQYQTRNGLEERYVAAAELAAEQLAPNKEKTNFDDIGVDVFEKEVSNWEVSTADWILTRLSPAARERFLDFSTPTSVMWHTPYAGYIVHYNNIMNVLAKDRKNLATIIETRAYER